MNTLSASAKRRQRRRALKARTEGKPTPAPRTALSPEQRRRLRAGCLRRIRPGDSVSILAARLNQSPRYVREAIAHDIRCVGEYLAEGRTVAEIATLRPEWSPAFVDLARRDIFGRKPRASRATSYEAATNGARRRNVAEPWKAYNRGQTLRRREEHTRRQAQHEIATEAERLTDSELDYLASRFTEDVQQQARPTTESADDLTVAESRPPQSTRGLSGSDGPSLTNTDGGPFNR